MNQREIKFHDFAFVIRPCVGCGYCCKKAPCIIGGCNYGTSPPCGGLVWDWEAKRYWCEQVLRATSDYDSIIRDELAIGDGCCSSLNTDRRKHEDRI